MRLRASRIGSWLCATGLAACAADAQTITSGNASFTWNPGAVPTDGAGIGGGSSNLDINGAAAGGDQLFENWWWYRVDGVDTREYRYHAPSSPFVSSGDTMTGTFQFDHFRSDLKYQLFGTDGEFDTIASLIITNTIVNTSDTPRTINLFAYADLDVNGELTNYYSYDAAQQEFEITDSAPTVGTAYFKGFGATAYQADFYTTTPGSRVRGLVADADIDNLNNTVSSSPGDFTGAFQWSLVLEPGAQVQIFARIGVNDQPPIPGPGFLPVAVIAASIGLGRRRR